MTLTEEEFKKEYKDRYESSDRIANCANLIHERIVAHPNLFSIDPRLNPNDKKVIMMPTPSLKSGIDVVIGEVLAIEGAKLVDSLDNADIAVYVGNYLCDYGKDGTPAIMPILNRVESRNLTSVVFTEGRLYDKYCAGKCPEYKFMYDLIGEFIKEGGIHKSRIIDMPLGWPYNKIPFMLS